MSHKPNLCVSEFKLECPTRIEVKSVFGYLCPALYCFLFLGFISSLIFVLKSAKFKSHLFLIKAIVSLGEKGKVGFCIIHSLEREMSESVESFKGRPLRHTSSYQGSCLMIGNLLE